MTPYFDEESLKKIKEVYDRVDGEYKDLLLKYTMFKFSNDEAREYATQGLMRRVRTLYRCIFNVFEITPPENMKPLTDELCADLSINLQSFVLNVFGSLDNIAWIWVKEKSFGFNRGDVGLKPKYKKLRNTLSPEFKVYVSKFDDWFQYLENYRDALAHRIPLYVPPFSLTNEGAARYQELEKKMMDAIFAHGFEEYEVLEQEQESLGIFYPWMTHSFIEKATPVVFHAQILADWATVVDIANTFYNELNSIPKKSQQVA